MGKIDFIFINSKIDTEQELIDSVFCIPHNYITANVILRFDNLTDYGKGIVEVVDEKIIFSDYDKYAIGDNVSYMTVQLEDDEYNKIETEIIKLLKDEYKYSYASIILGFISNKINRKLALKIATLLNCEISKKINSTMLAVDIIRTLLNDFCKSDNDSEITSEFLFNHILMAGYEKTLKIVDTKFSSI